MNTPKPKKVEVALENGSLDFFAEEAPHITGHIAEFNCEGMVVRVSDRYVPIDGEWMVELKDEKAGYICWLERTGGVRLQESFTLPTDQEKELFTRLVLPCVEAHKAIDWRLYDLAKVNEWIEINRKQCTRKEKQLRELAEKL